MRIHSFFSSDFYCNTYRIISRVFSTEEERKCQRRTEHEQRLLIFEEKFCNFSQDFEEKGVIMPDCHPSHALSAFASNVPSDEEPNVSFSSLPSEYRHSCELHVSSCKNEDNSQISDVSSVSSHPSPSRFHSILELKFNYLKNSRFYSTSMIFRDRASKSISGLQQKTLEEHISSPSFCDLPMEMNKFSRSTSEIKAYDPPAHFSSFEPTNHSKEEPSSYSYPRSLSSSKPKRRLPSKSSSLHSSTNHKEDISYHLTKEILGPT